MTTSGELVTASEAETEQAGARLGRSMRAGDVLLLVGALGAGKTAFVRGLAAGIGAAGHVSSPTFQLLHHHDGPLPLGHADLYRLPEGADLSVLGMDELRERGVLAIEWGDRLGREIDGAGVVEIEPLGGDLRRLTVRGGPDHWCW